MVHGSLIPEKLQTIRAKEICLSDLVIPNNPAIIGEKQPVTLHLKLPPAASPLKKVQTD